MSTPEELDRRGFVAGSRVRVLKDSCGFNPVPVGTAGLVIETWLSAGLTMIEYRAFKKERRVWMHNHELELIEGSRVDVD